MHIKSATFIKSSSRYQDGPGSDKPEYAFTGRSNVGKSSLINMLTGRNKLAKTSSTPGKTKLINHFLINEQWYLVDLPGYGYAKVSKGERKMFRSIVENYLLYRENLALLFLLIDVRHKPLSNDLAFIEWLGVNGVPFALVFTKTDKLNSFQRMNNIEKYKIELFKTWEELPATFITSSVTNEGRDEILDYINQTNKQVGA